MPSCAVCVCTHRIVEIFSRRLQCEFAARAHTWYIHRQSFVQTHTTPHGCLYITYISNVHVLGCGQKCMQSHCCVSCLLSAVQERLTREIATAISEAVQPSGVAVVIEAT